MPAKKVTKCHFSKFLKNPVDTAESGWQYRFTALCSGILALNSVEKPSAMC
jgi:hypothetical protein